MIVGIPCESVPGERRVALVPELIPKLTQAGLEVRVQSGAGVEAGFPDQAYREKGARTEANVFGDADIVLCVQPPAKRADNDDEAGAILIGLLEPLANRGRVAEFAKQKVTAFAMELMPRITRAQPMDALSAMSTVGGYKAVLIAAARLHKFFPS